MKRIILLFMLCAPYLYSFAQFDAQISDGASAVSKKLQGVISDNMRNILSNNISQDPKLYNSKNDAQDQLITNLAYNYLANRYELDVYYTIEAYAKSNNTPYQEVTTNMLGTKEFLEFLKTNLFQEMKTWASIDAVVITDGIKSVEDAAKKESILQESTVRKETTTKYKAYREDLACSRLRELAPTSSGKSVEIDKKGMFAHAVEAELPQESIYSKILEGLSKNKAVSEVQGSEDHSYIQFVLSYDLPETILGKFTVRPIVVIHCFDNKAVFYRKKWAPKSHVTDEVSYSGLSKIPDYKLEEATKQALGDLAKSLKKYLSK